MSSDERDYAIQQAWDTLLSVPRPSHTTPADDQYEALTTGWRAAELFHAQQMQEAAT